MLQNWLEGLSLEAFTRAFYLRRPYAVPGTALSATALGGWQLAAKALAAPERDVLVVAHGMQDRLADPRNLDEALALFHSGRTIVLRNVERHDADVRQLGSCFERDLKGRAQVHLFATPRNQPGFGWHYDAEEVFLLQTHGSKEYFLRRNTVNPEPLPETMPEDMQFERETSSVMGSTLVAGDWLYIPGGWWHAARAQEEDSLALSIGVLPPDTELRRRRARLAQRLSA